MRVRAGRAVDHHVLGVRDARERDVAAGVFRDGDDPHLDVGDLRQVVEHLAGIAAGLARPVGDEQPHVHTASGSAAERIVEGGEGAAVALLRLVRQHLDVDGVPRLVQQRDELRQLPRGLIGEPAPGRRGELHVLAGGSVYGRDVCMMHACLGSRSRGELPVGVEQLEQRTGDDRRRDAHAHLLDVRERTPVEVLAAHE